VKNGVPGISTEIRLRGTVLQDRTNEKSYGKLGQRSDVKQRKALGKEPGAGPPPDREDKKKGREPLSN